MVLLDEVKKTILGGKDIPTIYCSVFEHNKGYIYISSTPTMRPRTNHICIKYHNLRKHVLDKTVSITYVDTEEQISDLLLTKAMINTQFEYSRDKFMM